MPIHIYTTLSGYDATSDYLKRLYPSIVKGGEALIHEYGLALRRAIRRNIPPHLKDKLRDQVFVTRKAPDKIEVSVEYMRPAGKGSIKQGYESPKSGAPFTWSEHPMALTWERGSIEERKPRQGKAMHWVSGGRHFYVKKSLGRVKGYHYVKKGFEEAKSELPHLMDYAMERALKLSKLP